MLLITAVGSRGEAVGKHDGVRFPADSHKDGLYLLSFLHLCRRTRVRLSLAPNVRKVRT